MVVEDALDEKCGTIDLGHANIMDNQGSTIAQFDQRGTITGNNGSQLGQMEGFNYRQIRVTALYLMLIDPGMLNDTVESPYED